VQSGVTGIPCFVVSGRRHEGHALSLGAAIDEAMREAPAARLRTPV
jgi:hypothetical protein